MKTLLNPWFLTGCAVWLMVISLRRAGHPLPYLNGYITDAFAIPVIANLALWFQRALVKSKVYVLSISHVGFIVAYVSVVFEVLLPRYSAKYTGDWIDVILYIAGGAFFFFVMNKPLSGVPISPIKKHNKNQV